jgi:diguanylate cyclase (GGDEF)-like protein
MSSLSGTQIAFLMVASQQAVMSLGWLAGAALLKGSRHALLYWSLHAALAAAAVACLLSAVPADDDLVRAVGNLSIVASLIALQRGVWHFFGRSCHWHLHALLMAVSAAATLAAQPAHGAWRVGVVSASLAILCLSTAWDMHAQTRKRLELRWSALLAVPMLAAGLVFALRALAAVLNPRTIVATLSENLSFHAGAAIVYQIVGLGFQLALVALVVARFISQLQHASRQDALTGLLNRRAFDEALDAEVQRSRRMGEPFSVLMIDVDRFKAINDRHGHAAGDRALQHLATLLAGHMRDIDRVGRYGGEEFVVLLPATELSEAVITAERLRQDVQALPARWQEHPLALSISVGVAQWHGQGDSAPSLLARSDEALYRAKQAGRNCVMESG